MQSIRWFAFSVLLLSLVSTAGAETFTSVWSKGQLNQVDSFSAEDKIVGTHYFYWYQYPYQHFYDNAEQTDDSLQDHFPNGHVVDYNSIDWHEGELADCMDAGIDMVMPVYWGVVDNYFYKGMIFSIQGLGPLQSAIERRAREGKPSTKIAMFYDTSTLRPDVRGELNQPAKYDLREAKGKDIFYRTIRDYFYQIKPQHWAAIDGRPIVVLYGSGFVSHHDQSTFDYVYEQFAKDFHGIKPYIIRDNSWGAKTEAVTSWGAALGNANIFDKVAQIGPGYNDFAVPNRTTPVREREEGNFYRYSWNQVLDSNVDIVLIETWNEMHEGTDICESLEYGRYYIELTRHYADRFKQGLPSEEEIQLEFTEPVPRPPSTVGSDYANSQEISIKLNDRMEAKGINLVRGNEDGPTESVAIEGERNIRTVEAGNAYLYFSVVDPFYYDDNETLIVKYTFWDEGHAWHSLQYDSHDPGATLGGSYKNTPNILCQKSGTWKTNTIRLNDARFVNRQNGASDFRIAVGGGWLCIKQITISKVSSVQ